MVLCIPGITSSSLRRLTLGQVAAKVSPSRDCYIVTVQNRTCGSTPIPKTNTISLKTKYKDMRSQPRLKEKQGKEVRTSKIITEKHRYPRLDTVIQLHREMDTEIGWDTRHLPALSREAEHNCYGRKTNNQKAGYRDEHSVTQRVRCLTQPKSSSINRDRLQFNTPSKPKKCDFEFRFCQKCYKPPQNIKSGFLRQEKNGVIHSTQPNVQTAKNIEVTSSTTKREIIEATQINTQTARLAKIELLNKLNNNKLNTNNITAILVHNLPDPDETCLLYTSPSPRDRQKSRMPSSA